MAFNLHNHPASILDRLPSEQDLNQWFREIPLFHQRSVKVCWMTPKVQSPDSYTSPVIGEGIKAWVKFTIPTGVDESQVYLDLTLSPLPIPRILSVWKTDRFDAILLHDRPGLNLTEDKNALHYLPLAAQQLAHLQHYWHQSGIHSYGPSSFRYLDQLDDLCFGFNEQTLELFHLALQDLNEIPVLLTHGDSIPANWLRGRDGVGPLDFKEVTPAHCLLDLVQLLDQNVWAEQDPNGHVRRSAVWSYTSAMKSLGHQTPWMGNEDRFLRAAATVNKARILHWTYHQRLRWYGHKDNRIHPYFTEHPGVTLQTKNTAMLNNSWPALFP